MILNHINNSEDISIIQTLSTTNIRTNAEGNAGKS